MTADQIRREPRASLRLLSLGREVLAREDGRSALWRRVGAHLSRQGLEAVLEELWIARAQGVEQTSMKAQLICLRQILNDDQLATQVRYVWGALSEACHANEYALEPSRADVLRWIGEVEELCRHPAVVGS